MEITLTVTQFRRRLNGLIKKLNSKELDVIIVTRNKKKSFVMLAHDKYQEMQNTGQ